MITTTVITGPNEVLADRWANFWGQALKINIVALTLLPSGTLFGLNVKFILFILLFPIAVRLLFTSVELTWTRVLPVLLVPLGVFFWICIANANGVALPLTLNQAKDLLATITGAWFISIYCSLVPGNTLKIIRLILLTEICISIFKLGLFSFATVTGQDVTILLNGIGSFFKVTLSVSNFESDTLERFELASDGLLPLCLFALMSLRKRLGLSVGKATILSVLLLPAIFFTFSRYLWGFTVLVILLSYTLINRDKLHKWFLLVLIALSVATWGYTAKVVNDRYSDKFAGSSDEARTDQALVLQEFFFEKPLLGHGLGSYSATLLRNDETPYSYENQLGALAGQIGTIGCFCMLLLLVGYYYRAFFNTTYPFKYKLALSIIIVFWIFGGFVNPQVLTSQSSLSYGMILAILLTDPVVHSTEKHSEPAFPAAAQNSPVLT